MFYDLFRRGFLKPEDQEPYVDGLEFYLDAFRELCTSRPVSNDLQAIPFTAIAEYFKIYELQDFDEFAYIMRLMDTTYLQLNETYQKSQGDKNAASRKPNPTNHNKG